MMTEHPAFVRAKQLPERVRAFFPTSVEAAQEWEPQMVWRALSPRVLVVAVPRIECAWRAYCDAVPGIDHRTEYQAVPEHGAELPEDVARALFPIFNDVPYAR